MIAYLKNSEINKKEWDECIETAGNGIIYGYSLYLDAMSRNWDALVLDNYKAVMPLTWNRKYGICYLYQPFFSASLGIFGNDLTGEIVFSFLNAIPDKFQYWDIYLNRGNVFPIKTFPLYLRNNYILDLSDNYQNIYARFSVNHKRNIKRAKQLGCTIKNNIPIKEVVGLAKEQSKDFSNASRKDFSNFTELYSNLEIQKKATTYGVYNKAGELVSSSAFFFSHGRAYYIMVGNHPDGRMGASHLMIDQFIRDHAKEKLILDFEGSEIPDLARFYKSFGSIEEKYSAIKLNRLPRVVKLFKK